MTGPRSRGVLKVKEMDMSKLRKITIVRLAGAKRLTKGSIGDFNEIGGTARQLVPGV